MSQKPLQGIRVLDISRLLPGGFASLLLAEQGAEVIKIEQPGLGDYYRALTPDGLGLLPPHMRVIHRGKKSVALDLKTDRALFLKMVRRADVVIESFRPGALKRLGVDYPVLRKLRPDILLCSITGFEASGKQGRLAGHDINFLGLSGLLSKIRDRDGRPVIPDVQFTDLAAGQEAAFRICAALAAGRRRRGRWIRVSMLEAGKSFARFCDFDVQGPSPVSGGLVRYGVYETADGRHMTLGALEEKFWEKFCGLIGKKEWAGVPGLVFLGEEVRRELQEIFRSKTAAEWTELGLREDVCLFPVAVSIPLKPYEGTPRMGQHTRSVLRRLGRK